MENGGLEDDDLVSFWGPFSTFHIFSSLFHFHDCGKGTSNLVAKNQLIGIHQIWIKKPNLKMDFSSIFNQPHWADQSIHFG